ncbi:MAG: alpha/beta hydrolase [Lachnospiraceae bacterium]|nr:alpha/beta hydrolase [Lachnospiraceae bacterium]
MEKELHKLAVIFPGIGYTADKPLLYFGRRIAVEYGYEVRIMDYKGFPPKVKGDRNRMEESFFIALRQTEEMLAGVDFAEYDDIVFIGKSIGTIVAAKIAADAAAVVAEGSPDAAAGTAPESPAKARIRQVLYTPLEDTFRFPIGEAIAFTGDDDPWVGKENSRIPALCKERGIPCRLVPHANHSLESKDVFADMKELRKVMKETEAFLK